MANGIFIAVFIAFFAVNTIQEKGFKTRGLETAGERPVPKWMFVSGKLATLACWAAALAQACGLNMRLAPVQPALQYLAAFLFMGGFLILWAAYRGLGDANSTGLPRRMTALRSDGIYSYSRNPIYAGLYLMTAGAVIYCGCAVILLLGVMAVAVHHRIVLAEEKFLSDRFKEDYAAYKLRVRRYI